MGPLIYKAAATAQMPVNEALDAAVFVDFVGVDKAINEAAASARMMADKAINEVTANA